MSISEAQKRVVAKYNAKSYDEVKVRLSKGKKNGYTSHCRRAREKGVNGYIKEAVTDKIKADTGQDVEL